MFKRIMYVYVVFFILFTKCDIKFESAILTVNNSIRASSYYNFKFNCVYITHIYCTKYFYSQFVNTLRFIIVGNVFNSVEILLRISVLISFACICSELNIQLQ